MEFPWTSPGGPADVAVVGRAESGSIFGSTGDALVPLRCRHGPAGDRCFCSPLSSAVRDGTRGNALWDNGPAGASPWEACVRRVSDQALVVGSGGADGREGRGYGRGGRVG